jgi:hypothetical protein
MMVTTVRASGSTASESNGLMESEFTDIILYSFLILLLDCVGTSPRQLSPSVRPRVAGVVSLHCMSFLVPKLVEHSREKSYSIVVCIRALSSLIESCLTEELANASRLLKEMKYSENNVFDIKLHWLSVLAIPRSLCRCTSLAECPYFPILSAIMPRLDPDDSLVVLVASLRNLLSHVWEEESNGAAFQDLQQSVVWICLQISTALKLPSLKENASLIALTLVAISDFHGEYLLLNICSYNTHAFKSVFCCSRLHSREFCTRS